MRQRQVCLACFLLHFFLIAVVSEHETLWLVAHRLTLLPSSLAGFAKEVEPGVSGMLGQNLEQSNWFRRGLQTYLHLAGIEKGYGYFAPNIPAGYKLVFELHYPNGQTDFQLPTVNSAAAGLRVSTLLDEIGRTANDKLREHLVKALASPVWREHPNAIAMRAIFGRIVVPGINEFEQGEHESYEFLYAYDFSRVGESAEPQH